MCLEKPYTDLCVEDPVTLRRKAAGNVIISDNKVVGVMRKSSAETTRIVREASADGGRAKSSACTARSRVR